MILVILEAPTVRTSKPTRPLEGVVQSKQDLWSEGLQARLTVAVLVELIKMLSS